MQQSHRAMAGRDTDERLLVLSPQDNVAVVLRALSGGEWIRVSGVDVEIPMHIAVGHKIAIAPVERGGRIVKYGAPIGSATAGIHIGDHVHLHNIRSNYTPSHSLDAARGSNPMTFEGYLRDDGRKGIRTPSPSLTWSSAPIMWPARLPTRFATTRMSSAFRGAFPTTMRSG